MCPDTVKPEIDHHTTRLVVGLIALSLPFVTSFFSNSEITSLSAAYLQNGISRDIFVGFLFAIAAFLLSYNGKNICELVLSKVAALAALGVAIFPCVCKAPSASCENESTKLLDNIHGISAVIMFLILAYFCYSFYLSAKDKVEENEDLVINEKKSSQHPCHNGATILENCKKLNLSVSELVMLNESSWLSEKEINDRALALWKEMKEAIWRGCHRDGTLPGILKVKRRAKEMFDKLSQRKTFSNVDGWIQFLKESDKDFISVNKWISIFALAVNEENAAYGRIVTAPTNGASGVLPAVLMYAVSFLDDITEQKIIDFILTAGELGTLFKKSATISAAMGGCQAEIGVSSAMAAGALTEIVGGNVVQVENAAEIGMEHNLGLTCDPVGGLVQVPCIERNAMGAIKAINASRLAIRGSGEQKVSLDKVIKTMLETGNDMKTKYKETARGGLAVNIIEC